ncbi:UNVERIFIED_CONTAM: hypothetical protein GTU68_063558 [Idotea baltica]|nr:hypothetical protein [Idotea baltica]
MFILGLKALHIIGFISWFAGLFYLVRLFVYHAEALDRKSPEKEILASQYALMEHKLFNVITRPAMIITFLAGIGMLILNPLYIQETWMHIKLTLIIFLGAYTDWCKTVIKKLAKGLLPLSSKKFRLANEVPTVLLVPIVLLAVFRNRLSILALLGVVTGLILLLGLFFYLYSKARQKKEAK